MLVIKREQFRTLRLSMTGQFAYRLMLIYQGEGLDVSDEALLVRIINDAIGAEIKTEHDIYEYGKLALVTPPLLELKKPAWALNILYADVDPETKINALKEYLESA